MAGLPPGDPQLVSMIVSHLKTQGLFDQFRRDCLADVDTKPAYLNLKQRVDNFVSNHLSNHTWSPHLNKNQLRNNIRQLVLQSGMLEQGVDRIVAQVVDPKINHIFRPQVERVVREFLSPGSCSEEPVAPPPATETKPDSTIPEQASSSTPPAPVSSDAMSILDTITSLNQEASVRAISGSEKGQKLSDENMVLVEEGDEDMSLDEEGDSSNEGNILEEGEEAKLAPEGHELEVKTEETQDVMEEGKETLTEEIKMEEEEARPQDLTGDENDKAACKTTGKVAEEKQDEDVLKSTCQAKQKARERIKEEYSLEDSDLEGLSDITVSSVHTSDLSSFEEESEDEELPSDSSEEGEILPDGERSEKKEAGDEEKEPKPRRKAYVHKPFLYSRYYSDSDDEITVEERRRSAAKDKEERLLKRQQNRERMEEKRKQKAAQAEEQDQKNRKSGDSAALEKPRAKEARKEQKVLEKKMALSRKRKLDSRKSGDVFSRKKGDMGEGSKKAEVKSTLSKTPQPKFRLVSDATSLDERHRRTSGSISEDSSDAKKLCDKGRTHSFILELEQGSQEALKQRSVGKFDRLSRKEFNLKERKEKERSLSDERAKLKQKQEKKSEHQAGGPQQKEGASFKVSPEEKGDKKLKMKGEKKVTGGAKEQKAFVFEGVAEEFLKDTTGKKIKALSVETCKAEKDKDREKEKNREKDKDKEKDRIKGEKTPAKCDTKQPHRPDSTFSSADRFDIELGLESSKKKDKHFKEVLKRSKSHCEDKSKLKFDSKDTEKEKFKTDQDSQKTSKTSHEANKALKRVKTIEKGKILEKMKSKEDNKTPLLLLKTDKKALILEDKGVPGSSKPDTPKEKKKDGNVKEQLKATEDLVQNLSENKAMNKKMDKKDKAPEKIDASQEEKKNSTEDKKDNLDEISKSALSSTSLELEDQLKKQEISTDSEPITITVTTSSSDDTCDALSDITPEPSEGEVETEVGEVPAVPVEADALLALMDVCTSADARLPQESCHEVITPETTLQDADMKMKEAALTLLSMDPDSVLSSSFIIQDTSKDQEVTTSTQEPMETAVAEEEQQPPTNLHSVTKTALPAAGASPGLPPQTHEPLDEDTYNQSVAAEEPKTQESETDVTHVETSACLVSQDADAVFDELQTPLNTEESEQARIATETQPDEELSLASPVDKDASGTKEEEGGAKESAVTVFYTCGAELVTEMSSQQEQIVPDVVDVATCPMTAEIPAEESPTETGTGNEELRLETQEEPNTAAESSEPQTVEPSALNKADGVEEGQKTENQSEPVQKNNDVPSSDSHEVEKGSDLSEKEEKTGGRGRRKRRISSQTVAEVPEPGNTGGDSAETQIPQEPSPGKKDNKKQGDQDLTPKKPGRRGRPPKVVAPPNVKDNWSKDEEKADKTSGGKSADKEEKSKEESRLEIYQANVPASVQEDNENAGCAGKGKPLMKRKRSEGVEESVEGTLTREEVKQDIDQLKQSSPAGSQPNGQKVMKKEEGQKQGDQEMTPKKPGRRGRPPKAVAPPNNSDNQSKDDEKADKTPAVKEESSKEESRLDICPANPPATAPEDNENAGRAGRENADSGKPQLKRKRSEEVEESMQKEKQKQGDQEMTPKKPGRRGRPPKAVALQNDKDNRSKDEDQAVKTSAGKSAEKEEKSKEERRPEICQANLPDPEKDNENAACVDKENTDTGKPPLEKNSEEVKESVEGTLTQEVVKQDIDQLKQSSPAGSQPNGKEGEKKEEQQKQGDPQETPKKPARRGRPPKALVSQDDIGKKDKPAEETMPKNEEEEDGNEASTRATTRSASRLEAERKKPSKPSTRASRQNGKEETTTGTRGTRGQAAVVKGGRKREASPPAVRTRGGQKSEEPPSKRAKR